MNNLPKTVTRHRCDCDLNPGPSAPERSTLTTRLSSHPVYYEAIKMALVQFSSSDEGRLRPGWVG